MYVQNIILRSTIAKMKKLETIKCQLNFYLSRNIYPLDNFLLLFKWRKLLNQVVQKWFLTIRKGKEVAVIVRIKDLICFVEPDLYDVISSSLKLKKNLTKT